MSELTTIRQALADALEAGLGASVQVSAWRLADPTFPSVEVWPAEIVYHRAMQNGHAEWTFTVRAYTALSTDRGGQELLDSMLGVTGDLSVKAAVEADKTLGGVCDRLTVSAAGNYQPYVTSNGTQLVGADWTVTVYE